MPCQDCGVAGIPPGITQTPREEVCGGPPGVHSRHHVPAVTKLVRLDDLTVSSPRMECHRASGSRAGDSVGSSRREAGAYCAASGPRSCPSHTGARCTRFRDFCAPDFLGPHQGCGSFCAATARKAQQWPSASNTLLCGSRGCLCHRRAQAWRTEVPSPGKARVAVAVALVEQEHRRPHGAPPPAVGGHLSVRCPASGSGRYCPHPATSHVLSPDIAT